jgi:hypothetical protein
LELTAIGWSLNLKTKLVGLAQKNRDKMIYAFLSVMEGGSVPRKTLERLASLAARYQQVIREAKPLTAHLYKEFQLQPNRRGSIAQLSQQARDAIRIWRILMVLQELCGPGYLRHMDSYRPRPRQMLLRFDGCLEGIGIGLDRVLPTEELLGYRNNILPFDLLHDASYQNFSELLAVVIGQLQLALRGERGLCIGLRGDSQCVLTWASTDKFRGRHSTTAIMAHILIGIKTGFTIDRESDFVAGVANTLMDDFSRGATPSEKGLLELSQTPAQREAVLQFIQLCDPISRQESGELDLLSLWLRMSEWINLHIPTANPK